MNGCAWCGKSISGEPLSQYECPAVSVGDGDRQWVVVPTFLAVFCYPGCAWSFGVESHRLYGLSGSGLRTHLIEVHGLIHPPGKPGGCMSAECSRRFQARAKAIAEAFGET